MSKQIFLEHATTLNNCTSLSEVFTEIEIIRDRLLDINSDYLPAITRILEKKLSYTRPSGVSFFQFFLELLHDEYNLELSQELQPINGVGILRFPNKQYQNQSIHARHYAEQIANGLKQGSILVLPNTRDSYGNYEWDFSIINGSFSQVTVERSNGTNE